MKVVEVSKAFLEIEFENIRTTYRYVDSWVYKRACQTSHLYMYANDDSTAKVYFLNKKLKKITYLGSDGKVIADYVVGNEG